MGYNFTASRISHFLTDFCMELKIVQPKGAACDEKNYVYSHYAYSIANPKT